MNNRLSSPIALLLAASAGACSVLAFAPFGWWPVQLLTLALMFGMTARDCTIRHSALLGWAYGFGWMACGVYWLYVSMHRYGGMPAWMAALAVVLFAAGLGAFTALAMGGTAWLRQRWHAAPAMTLLMLAPAAWALTEWLRGWVFTGFPWIVSGYAHTGSPLAGFAPLIGVYGIGWLAAILAGCLALLPHDRRGLLLAMVILGTGYGLKSIDWTEAHGQPISVRLLQGNVPQEIKFDSEQLGATLGLYYDLIRQAPADLIATPETAIPLLPHQLPPDYLELLAGFARQSHSHLALGIPVSDGPQQYSNAVMVFPQQPAAGMPPYRYEKHHLVPFGEFIPTGFRWFVDMLRIPLGDQTSGATLQMPFAVKDQWILPNICYEDLFGEEIANQLAASYFSGAPQASILLNMSNIAWFGDSLALPQHLQISQMRTLETRRPMLRATNTGMTAIINPKGKVTAQLPPLQHAALAASVQGYQGATPYILFGNSLMVGMTALILALAWLLQRKTRRNSHNADKNR